MNLLKWIAVLFILACGLLALARFTMGQNINCSTPMWPCALHQSNAQLTVVPLPSPVPFSGLTGANTCWKTLYGTTMCRCTDVNTDTTSTKHHSYEIQDGGGANGQPINADGTMAKLLDADHGVTHVMGVDPAGHRCTGMLPNSEAGDGSVWDAVNPDMDYVISGTVISRRTGFHNAQGPVTAQLVDLSQVCPFGTTLPFKWHSPLSTDGSNLSVAFSTSSAQDTGIYGAIYNLAKGGCQVLNTSTSTIAARGYGNAGHATGTNGVFPFVIHDMFLFGGGWATIGGKCTGTGCPAIHGPYLWKAGSTTMNLTTALAGGHEAMGINTYTNFTDSPKMVGRLATTVNTTWFLNSNTGVKFPFPQESHCGWRNVNWDETWPIWCTQVSQNEQQPIKPVTPLEQELWGVDPKTGVFLRIAPTLTSGICNQFNFRTCNAILATAPRTATQELWLSTDAMGGLGNSDGVHTTCIPGAPPPNECRSDVAVVFP